MENELKPKLRFKEFDASWKKLKISNFIKKMYGGASISPSDYQTEGIPTIPKSSVNSNGIANLSNSKYVSESYFKKNFSSGVYPGDFVTSLRDLVPTAPSMGRIVKVFGNRERYLIPQGVYKLILQEDIDENFLIYISNSYKFRKNILKIKSGSTQVHIRNSQYLGIEINAPIYEEQKRIGVFLKKLDNIISLNQQELDALKKTKQGFLQKMFPRNGETKPVVRFEEYEENWKQKKLGDILKVNSGRDYKHLDEGNIPVYGTGGLMLNVNESLSNEDAIGIGRKGTIDKPQLLRAPFWTVDTLFFMTMKKDIDLYFCFSLITRIPWKKYDESTGVPSLSKTNIDKIAIKIPSYDEQVKIGNFFKKLDAVIELKEQELEALKQTKQGFLQKMFV